MNIGFKAKLNQSLVVTMISINRLIVVIVEVKISFKIYIYIYIYTKLRDVTIEIYTIINLYI